MRIVCQKCSAAYAIDDKHITPKGVRAQCPRCRHLQLVKKGDAEPAEAAPPANGAPAQPGPPPPAAAAGAPSAFLFDLEAPPSPRSPSASAPAPAPAPPPPAADPAPGPNVGTELDFGEFDLGAPPSSADLPPAGPSGFEMPPESPPIDEVPTRQTPAAPSKDSGVVVKCRTCGKVLSDPFDQAIGICDDCRAAVDSANQPVPPPPPPAPKASSSRPSAPTPASAAPASAPPRRASSAAAVAMSADDGGGKGKLAILLVAGVLMAGIVTVLLVKKPWQRRPPPLVTRVNAGVEKPIDRAVEKWKLNFPEDLVGSSADHLAAGEEQLAKDTGPGYLEAEEEFQKALMLDKSSDRAIAGWVLAMAFGRGSGIDDETAKLGEQLLVAAEQRGGAGRVYTAHAHLLLAIGGNMNDIKVMAERGKNSPSDRDQALALLALGQSMLSKNPQYAAESFAQALKLDPKLKRAYLAQSKLLLSLGRYRDAVANIEKRLALDPDQWEAADALARTWIEVGELGSARKVYEKASSADPRNFRARLALAILAYQHENNVDGAIAQLDAQRPDDPAPGR